MQNNEHTSPILPSCSLCGSIGVNRSTCPLNPQASQPNSAGHPNAVRSELNMLQMPDLVTDSIYDEMGYNNVLNLRGTSRDVRNRVDKYLIRKHRMLFGPTSKDMELIIKDLLLNRVFDKLRSKLRYVNPYKLCQYGIGDIIGKINSNNSGRNIKITTAAIPDEADFYLDRKVEIADSLALEFPHIADKIRIALHHFVNNLRIMPNGLGAIFYENYTEYRQSQGEAGRRILEQYQHDISLPNPGKEIRSVIYNMFYSGTRHRICNNDVNSLNGLLPSPILGLTKIIPAILNNPKYETLGIDYFLTPPASNHNLSFRLYSAQSWYRTLLKNYKKRQSQQQQQFQDQEPDWMWKTCHLPQDPESPDRRHIIVQYYKGIIMADDRLTKQDRDILFSYLAYKIPNIEAAPAEIETDTFVESSEPISVGIR